MSPRYYFQARDWDGRWRQGDLTAPNLREALAHLRSRNLVVLDLKENGPFFSRCRALWSRAAAAFSPARAGSRELMVFCRQFGAMLQAGISPLQALQLLTGNMEQPRFREELREVILNLEQGKNLAESFHRQEKYFPAILTGLVAAGEAGGVLGEVMERLAGHFEQQLDLEEKIRAAAFYPLLISAVACAVLGVMILFVLPQFAQIFDSMGITMPPFASALLAAGRFALNHWPALLACLLIVVAGWNFYGRSEQGRCQRDRLRLRLPLVGSYYRQALYARLARTLSMLLGSGINLIAALELAGRAMDNRFLAATLDLTREAVSRGESLADALQGTGFFPALLLEMVRAGEASGTLADLLGHSAAFYEREISYLAARLGTRLEPILLLFVGGLVGALVYAIFTPIFQVFQML